MSLALAGGTRLRLQPARAACLTLEIFGILVGSMVLLFFVIGTVFQVSSLCPRCSLCSRGSTRTKGGQCIKQDKYTATPFLNHFPSFQPHTMKYYRSADRWAGVGGFLSAGHNSISAGYRDRKSACMPAGFLSHCSCADVTLSLKEDLDCSPDLAVSCCPWRAAAGALFFALLALQS